MNPLPRFWMLGIRRTTKLGHRSCFLLFYGKDPNKSLNYMAVNVLILHRKIDFILTDLDEAKVYCIQGRTATKSCCFLNLRILCEE